MVIVVIAITDIVIAVRAIAHSAVFPIAGGGVVLVSGRWGAEGKGRGGILQGR